MNKILPLLIFAVALVLLQNSTRVHQWLDPINTEQLEAQEVILYSTRQCPYCAKTRRLFRNANIPFIEYDVEQSADHYRDYKQHGGNGVPLIVIGPTVVHGYDPGRIRDAIEALHPTTTTGSPASPGH